MSRDIRPELGLRRIINAAGTMTALGASIVVPEARAAMAASLDTFFDMHALHARASAVIAELTGAEAGFVTASSASAITLAIAATMTGSDLAAVERLPNDTGPRHEVLVQAGHLINFGAPVEQMIRLSGARPAPIGQVTSANAHQLAAAISDHTTAGLYVVSHDVVPHGQIPLETFIALCHARNVPVIVDAASEYDLRSFLAQGADLVIYSGHKFLGGPTSGILAGSRELIRAAFLQNRGIGRAMKVGKESIIGAMAALAAWKTRDHAAIRATEREALDLWLSVLTGRAGVTAAIIPDPTGNPLDRVQVGIDPALSRISAWDLADKLATGDRAVMVREEAMELGQFCLDPCNLHPGEAHIVATRLAEELDRAVLSPEPLVTPFPTWRLARETAALFWPD